MEIRPGDILFTFIPEWESKECCDTTVISKVIARGLDESLIKSVSYIEDEVEITKKVETKILNDIEDLYESYLVEKNIWDLVQEDLDNNSTWNYTKIKEQFNKLIEYLHS